MKNLTLSSKIMATGELYALAEQLQQNIGGLNILISGADCTRSELQTV